MGLKKGKKAKEVKKEVVEETPVVEEQMEQAVADAPDNIEDVVSMEGVSFASPTFPEDFVYDLKLGRALYENLSFEQLMLTLNGLLGKVDKVMITKK